MWWLTVRMRAAGAQVCLSTEKHTSYSTANNLSNGDALSAGPWDDPEKASGAAAFPPCASSSLLRLAGRRGRLPYSVVSD
jgi:hypothetical protein